MDEASVIVRPGSREGRILGYDSGRKAWIISLKSVPEKNQANRELL